MSTGRTTKAYWRVVLHSPQLLLISTREVGLSCTESFSMIVSVRLREHSGGMEQRHRFREASLVVNNEFITANFCVVAAPDPYWAHENGHHAVVTRDWAAGAGAAFDEQCDLRLIGSLISISGSLRGYPEAG
jgi:hypothetical protein